MSNLVESNNPRKSDFNPAAVLVGNSFFEANSYPPQAIRSNSPTLDFSRRKHSGDLYGGQDITPWDHKYQHRAFENLVHAASSSRIDTYLDITQNILNLHEPHPYIRAITPGGTSACLAAAIVSCAYFVETTGSPRSEFRILASRGAHASITEDLNNIYDVHTFALQPADYSIDESDLRKQLAEVKPGLLFLTVGRTDDGYVEAPNEAVLDYCLANKILVAVDASVGSPIALLPEYVPRVLGREAMSIKKVKSDYVGLISHPAIKLVIGGCGKFIGDFGISAIFLTHVDKDEKLQKVAKHVFHQDNQDFNYFPRTADKESTPMHGFFGSYTFSSRSPIELITSFSRVGIWPLRLLSFWSHMAASNTRCELLARNNLGDKAKVANVYSNVLSIELPSHEEAERVQERLNQLSKSSSINMAVARRRAISPGIRYIFPISQITTPFDCLDLALAIESAVLGCDFPNPRPAPITFELPKGSYFPSKYFVDRRHLYYLQFFYDRAGEAILEDNLYPPFFEKVRDAKTVLSVLNLNHGVDCRDLYFKITRKIESSLNNGCIPILADYLHRPENNGLEKVDWEQLVKKWNNQADQIIKAIELNSFKGIGPLISKEEHIHRMTIALLSDIIAKGIYLVKHEVGMLRPLPLI